MVPNLRSHTLQKPCATSLRETPTSLLGFSMPHKIPPSSGTLLNQATDVFPTALAPHAQSRTRNTGREWRALHLAGRGASNRLELSFPAASLPQNCCSQRAPVLHSPGPRCPEDSTFAKPNKPGFPESVPVLGPQQAAHWAPVTV